MKSEYIENEIKILDIDVVQTCKILDSLHAKKVFEADREITTFDTPEGNYRKQDKIIRITKEGSTKVTMHVHNSHPEEKEVIQYKISRAKEQIEVFKQLGLIPKTYVKSHRISYEWNGLDLDIDTFPGIPPFMEVDLENGESTIEALLQVLKLPEKQVVRMGTEAIYMFYGKDYFIDLAIV